MVVHGRKPVTYGKSKSGKVWKRQAQKRSIPCPMCHAATQWPARHLRQCHKLSNDVIQQLLTSTDDYRRRGAGQQQSRKKCPIAGCSAFVVRLSSHIKAKHISVVYTRTLGRNTGGLSPAVSQPTADDVETDSCSSDIIPPSPNSRVSTLTAVSFAQSSPNTSESGTSYSQLTKTTVTNCVRDDKKVTTSVDETIQLFETLMASIDGGSKVRPETYSLAAKQIVRSVGGQLTCLTKENVKNKYVEPCLRNESRTAMSIKTVRGKLLALEYFCKFVRQEILLSSDSGECSGDLCSNLSELEAVLPAWRQSLRTKCNIEEVKRRVQDDAECISPQDIQSYLCSEYARQAEHMLLSARVSESLSIYDFTRCRNHLLVLLSVGNAHRTGVLTHFTIADYEASMKQAVVGAENHVFTISEHKTASTHGAATLAVNSKEAKLLAGYMKLRKFPQFAKAEHFVFITATLSKMTQSNVSSALTAAFANSGFNDRVNCTKLRKSAVTQIHGNHPDKRADLASHMCHRVATAEKHYRLVEKKSNTVACSQLLRETFNDGTHGPDIGTEPSVSSMQTETDLSFTSVPPAPYQKRIRWSTENRDLIFKKFASFVRNERTPIAEIEQTLLSDPVLHRKLEEDMNMRGRMLVHAVKDKVRSFFRAKYGYKKH